MMRRTAFSIPPWVSGQSFRGQSTFFRRRPKFAPSGNVVVSSYQNTPAFSDLSSSSPARLEDRTVKDFNLQKRSWSREWFQNAEERRKSSSYIWTCLTAVGILLFSEGRKWDLYENWKKAILTWLQKSYSAFAVNAAKPLDDNGINSGEDVVCPKCGSNSANDKESRRNRYNFIADVLESVQDAVVCIEVKDHSRANWFGHPEVAGNGSGFIVKEDGLILTNAHVVSSHKQRNSISIKLRDGRCFPGIVEHIDYDSDLATVRVNARCLPTLKLGCSSQIRLGEWVVAVGSPLNLANTVTAGVISSTRRGASEIGIGNDINYIQTDAAITFGNSGGPLINLDGEAIGINSMKVTAGISFAIPIDHAKRFLVIAESMRAKGKVKPIRRYMGLTLLTLDAQIRKELETRSGLVVPQEGVFVWQVVSGGPAFLAGLLPGDIILEINGQKISSASQVYDIIKTDDELVMEVQRGERHLHIKVVPETLLAF